MLPVLPKREVDIAGVGTITIHAMTARCFVEMVDARKAEKSEIEVAAIIAKHCVVGWEEHTVDDVLDNCEPSALTDIMVSVVNMAENKKGKSATGQRASLSSS